MVRLLPNNKGKTIGVLDIGNSAVKGLFFKEEKQGLEILEVAKEDYEIFGVYDGREFELEVIKRAVEKILKKLESKEIDRPEEFIFGLPANLLKARIVNVSSKRENGQVKITAQEEALIRQKALKKAEKLTGQRFASQSGIMAEELFFITRKYLDFKIDGYRVSSLQGLTGRSINFKILLIFLPQDYLKKITRLSQSLKIKIKQINHEVEGLPTLMANEENSLFLNVGGSFTQVYWSKKGLLIKIAEIGLGSKNFTERLAEKLGLTMSEADNFKRRYQQGLLSEPVRERVRTILMPLADEWLGKLKKIIGQEIFFEKIFLWGGGAFELEIKEIIEKNFEREAVNPKVTDFLFIKDKNQKVNHYQLLPLVFLTAANQN